MGRFKIYVQGGTGSYWVYFNYRNTNGVTETKQCNNAFAKWEVGGIPNGAILC